MKRADELLVDLSLVKSRSKARAIIEEGKVFVNGKAVDKPSRKFPEDTLFEISAENTTLRYVSRAGLKLEEFLKYVREFNLEKAENLVSEAIVDFNFLESTQIEFLSLRLYRYRNMSKTKN